MYLFLLEQQAADNVEIAVQPTQGVLQHVELSAVVTCCMLHVE